MIKTDGHIVLGDFGLACSLEAAMSPESHLSDSLDSLDSDGGDIFMPVSCDICGTLPYMAPEVLCGMEYSYSVDWFAYGVFLHVFYFNKVRSALPPFTRFDHLDIVSLAGIARESNELSESIDVNTVTRGHLPEQVVRRPLEEGRHPQLQRRPPINPSS